MKTKMNFFVVPATAVALLLGSCQKEKATVSTNRENLKGSESKISQAPPKGTLINGDIYRIRGLASINGGPAVEVTGNVTTEGAQIQQWNWFPNNGQKWKLQLVESNYYKLINLTSNKALHSSSSTSGAVLTQSTSSSSTAQQWAIAYNSANDAFTLTNRANGLKVAVDPYNNTPGTKIKQLATLVGNQGLFEFKNLHFQNPILSDNGEPKGSPDPYVVQKDGWYYMLYTDRDDVNGTQIYMRKTKDMSLVAQSPKIMVYDPPATSYSKQIWAPEMFFLEGKWYIYFAGTDAAGGDVNHRMHVIENANADPTTGSWTYKGKISDPTNQWAIDGTVVNIQNTLYFVWSGWDNIATMHKQHIYIATMSNPWTITGSRVKIVTPTETWEKWEPADDQSNPDFQGVGVCEGPQFIRENASQPWFLTYSASRYTSDNYCLATVRLTPGSDPKVPSNWTNKTQVFVKNPGNSIFGPGHNGFFKSSYVDPNGTTQTETWFVYHARSVADNSSVNRKSRMQKLTFNAAGTPNFGTAVASTTVLNVPIGE